MKIKQYFPVIAILLFSILLSIGTTAYLFFITKYPEDITARLWISLRQGVVFGIVSFVLLLVGVGLNTLLARIADASRRRWVSLAVYLGSLLLCLVLPAILIASTWFIFSEQSGWQELPAVTEPAVQVASAGKDAVIVRSDDGNHYYCWTKQLTGCWEPADEPVSPLLQSYEGELEATSNSPGATPPQDVIDLVGISYNQSAIFYESHYAVTSDGRVWYLNRETNNGTAGFATGFLFVLTLPVMLGTLAVLAGAGMNSGARWLANRIWQETNE
jgi:hypothetical protein